ncbi:MAG: hypothetical protein AAGM22_23530 [Acidobacteriota bacterium]
MIRNAAIVIVVIAVLVIFQPHIKAGIMEGQNAFALSRIEVSDEKKTELRQAISRIADGYQKKSFSDVEFVTLTEQLAELRSHAGSSLEDEQADAYLRRFETILERYQL